MRRNGPVVAALALFSLFPASPRGAAVAPSPILTLDELNSRIRSIVASKCLDGGQIGIDVLSLKDGREIFSRNPDRPLKPASNMKLFTSAAALALLKPDYVFPTVFYASAPPRQGVVSGDLYIKGFGAPDLVGEFWWLMVQELSRQGLREIRGDLVADDTYFDPVERPLVWPRTVPEDSWVSAPVGALSFNYDVVTIRVRPGPTVGSRPFVELIPLPGYFRVNNRSVTTAARGGLVVGRGFQQGRNTINVSGSIRLGSAPTEVTKGVEEPALYALAAFQELAARQGIVVRGKPRRAAIPEDAVELFRFES